MKRIISLLLALTMVFALCACGKSDNAKYADEMIMSIGEVDTDSESAIVKAEKAVASLSDDEKQTLDNLGVLEQARHDYDMLFAQVVIDLIDAIGELSYDSESAIETAESAYNALTATQKALVANYETLTDSREQLPKIKIQTAQEMINQLGSTPTIEDFDKIIAVLNSMSDEELKQVDNYDDYCEKYDAFYEEYAASLLTSVKIWIKTGNILDTHILFKNNTDKVIKYITFNVRYYNKVGDLMTSSYGQNLIGLKYTGPFAKGEGMVSQDMVYSADSSTIDTWNVGSVDVYSVVIEYTDGSVVALPGRAVTAIAS